MKIVNLYKLWELYLVLLKISIDKCGICQNTNNSSDPTIIKNNSLIS
jgi:hypothetical protein